MKQNLWKIYNSTGKYRVIVTKTLIGKNWIDILTKGNCRIEVYQERNILGKTDILEAIGNNCDGCIGQLSEKWDEDIFKQLKKAGGRAYSNVSVGYDNLDIHSATRLGIPVGNTPGVSTEANAEFCVAMTFSAARRVVESDKFMRSGQYKGWLMNLFVG
jgi:hydroxypyruvate reductase 1